MATRRRRNVVRDLEVARVVGGIVDAARSMRAFAQAQAFARDQDPDASERMVCACGWRLPRQLSIEGLGMAVALRVVVVCPGCAFAHHVRFTDGAPSDVQRDAERKP